ncbi:MAG: OadG family protein [Chloroflexi bacterium]|nr:OadG family protein [Chloroflexota bacterium]
MGVDWGFAALIGGVGFGVVFGLLIVLAVIIQVTGRIVNRSSASKKTDGAGKGA